MALAGFNGQVQDLSGNAVATVSIEVRRESDNGLASLFEDADGVTPLGNPFANDPGDVGHFLFHVAGGSYRIRAFTVEGDVMLWRHVGIGTMAQHDVEEFLPVTGGTLTAAAFPTLTIERTTALTNALQGALRLLTTTSGVMADGFATGFNFALQDDNDVVNDVATVSARRAGADNTGSLVFSTFNAGVLGDRVVIDHATFTYNGTAVLTGGKHTIWIPASAMRARASNGAEPATAFSGANANEFSVFNFDQTTMEGVFFNIAMPKGWDEGNLTFIPIWSALAGSAAQTVRWLLEAKPISNDDSLDAGAGATATSDDALIATNDLHIGPESGNLNVAATEGDLVLFFVFRDPSNDNLAGDARLIGIKLHYNINAATDA